MGNTAAETLLADMFTFLVDFIFFFAFHKGLPIHLFNVELIAEYKKLIGKLQMGMTPL